jgi:hypothetical protein
VPTASRCRENVTFAEVAPNQLSKAHHALQRFSTHSRQNFLSVEERRHESPRIVNDLTNLRELFFEDLRISSLIDTGRKAMTKLTVLSAAAVLSMMAATPVFAMPAVQEPGALAFAHPNADVLNVGVRSPARSLGALAFLPSGKSHTKRHVAHR